MKSPLESVPAPISVERNTERKRSVIEVIRGRGKKERNRFPADTYEFYLQEAKNRYSGLSIQALEELRDAEKAEESEVDPSAPGFESDPVNQILTEEKFSLFEHPNLPDDTKAVMSPVIEMLEDPSSVDPEGIIEDFNGKGMVKPVPEAANAGVSEVIKIVNKPYYVRAITFTDPNDPTGEEYIELEIVEYTKAEEPEVELDLHERAEKDALEYIYAKALAEILMNGQELTPEQKMFILENAADAGLNSALAELSVRKKGFASFQKAGQELKIKSGVFAGQQFIKEPEKGTEKLPPSVQNALKAAKIGALTAGGVAIAALFLPALVPTAVAMAGGVIGSAIARGAAGYFTRDKAIFGKGADGQPAISEKAFLEMAEGVKDMRSEIARVQAEVEALEDPAEKEKAYAVLLNQIVDKQLNGSTKQLDVYRNKIKSARKVEFAASLAGGIIGSSAAGIAHSYYDAYHQGVQITHAPDGTAGYNPDGHLVKMIRGDWHQVLTPDDIQKGVDAHAALAGAGGHHHILNAFDHSAATGSHEMVNFTDATSANMMHVNGSWSGDHFNAIHGYFNSDATNTILGRAGTMALEGTSLSVLTGELFGMSNESKANLRERYGRTGLAKLYDDTVPMPEPVTATNRETPEDERVPTPEVKSATYEYLTLSQEEKITKAIRGFVTGNSGGLSVEILEQIFRGEIVDTNAAECPRSIRLMLGFEDSAMSRDAFLLSLDDALLCANDVIDGIPEDEVSILRRDDLKELIGSLYGLTKDKDNFADTELSLREHIRYSNLKNVYQKEIKAIEEKDTFDKGQNISAVTKQLNLAGLWENNGAKPEDMKVSSSKNSDELDEAKEKLKDFIFTMSIERQRKISLLLKNRRD
jgi:hypothetical protein